MNSALDMTFMRHLRFPSDARDDLEEIDFAQMDDEYVAVFIRTGRGGCLSEGWCTVHFVSTKTFLVRRSLCIARKYGFEPQYERGFLVLQSKYDIR